MTPNLDQLGDINSSCSLLQVLVDHITLTTLPEGGLRLEVSITDSSLVVTSGADKKKVAAVINQDEGRIFEQHCLQMRSRAVGSTSTTTFQDFYLRHGSAGVLPTVSDDVTRGLVLFERDIDPMGWNIANGGSHDEEELSNINNLLRREAGEEILFFNAEEKTLHRLAGIEASEELELACSLWLKKLDAQEGQELSWHAAPGTDELVVSDRRGNTTTTAQLTLAVNALDFGIECCQIICIEGASSLIPLDGEILGGDLLDRRVGLFNSVETLRAGTPDALYWNGTKKAVADNRTTALCPVTEKIVARLQGRSS